MEDAHQEAQWRHRRARGSRSSRRLMARKPETRRQIKVREALHLAFPGLIWEFKVHGSDYQRAGLPDIIGCVCGLFFGFEVKNPGEIATELQLYELKQIKKAGGIAAIVIEPDTAVRLVRHALAAAARRRRLDHRAHQRRRRGGAVRPAAHR